MFRWVLPGGTITALVSLIVEFGFPISDHTRDSLHWIDAAVVALLTGDVFFRLARAGNRLEHLRQAWIEFVLVGLLVLSLAAFYASKGGTALPRVALLGAQAYLLARIVLDAARANERIVALPMRPAWILLGSFVLLILAGTGLLLLPRCKAEGVRDWSFTDALFTATSACCVTGLSVRDVGRELSIRGQVVLLGLIQAGGLGIVTMAMLFTFLHSRKLRLHQMTLVRDLLSVEVLGDLGRFLVHMLVVTLCAELLGAAVLFRGYAGAELDLAGRAWWGLFHSVSAFCNAGFGLQSDSFAQYVSSPTVTLMLCALAVSGGLGFPVIHELLHIDLAALPVIRRWRARGGGIPDGASTRISLHAKIVLSTSAVLIVAGSLLFYASERGDTLRGLPFGTQALASIFQAIMPRTTGFSTLDVAAFGPHTKMLLMILMVVGASPCSCGGGVKTTSIAALFLTVRAILRNRDPIDAFGRSLPRRTLNAAVAIVLLYCLMLAGVVLALLLTQEGVRFLDILFESISSLSTVGLSVGVSGRADTPGRLILCVAMLIGRVGPLAMLWAVVSRPPALRYEYPEEGVMVS